MAQALYRKYRSKSFDSVVGQDHIVKTLQNTLASGRISHAYLFTGPRGVGKTSVARILAHQVNGLEYSDETTHLDIIEIDAASNRRIDEIRDLRERVRVAPATAKYKVYIIDEVHMLTREAFNALLKTLEEPPAHAIFILATTEAHKLPETIISRTQRFEFKPVSKAQAARHLGDIAKKEKISVSNEALELLAEFGNGSFRDSISYLDQLSSLGKKITEDDVRSILGLPTAKAIDQLLDVVFSADSAAILQKLIQIEEQGTNPAAVAAALSGRLRAKALSGGIERWQIDLLKELSRVSASSRPQEALEIVLLEAGNFGAAADTSPKPNTKPKIRHEKTKNEEQSGAADFNLSQWENVVSVSKSKAASIYTALRLAEPQYADGILTLRFQFPLHQKKLAQASNKDLVAKIIKEVSGADIGIEVALKPRQPIKPEVKSLQTEPVSAINNIFGGAEVLEA